MSPLKLHHLSQSQDNRSGSGYFESDDTRYRNHYVDGGHDDNRPDTNLDSHHQTSSTSRSRHQSNQSNYSARIDPETAADTRVNDQMSENVDSQLCPVAGTNGIKPTTTTPSNETLSAPDIIEILKNLAACKEKQYKWEQSAKQLASFPDSDPNKSQMMEIIDFVENNKTTTKEKAISLYEQLALKCNQNDNYIGSAKAYERAAALHYEHFETETTDEKKETIAFATIRCLEEAIRNYSAIHKYKHAGTLHYRCSIILKLIDAAPDQVERHHIKALEYFTKPDHELKHRKRIDGLKISCYSSFSSKASRLSMLNDKDENFTTTTTTTTNTIKFHADRCFRNDSDDSDSNHSPSPPPPSSSNQSPISLDAKSSYNDDYRNAYSTFGNFLPIGSKVDNPFFDDKLDLSDVGGTSSQANSPTPPPELIDQSLINHHYRQQQSSLSTSDNLHQSKSRHSSLHSSSYIYSHHQHHKKQKLSASSTSANPVSGSSSSNTNSNQCNNNASAAAAANKNPFRCIEDRIESARKLVKKLNKTCPFYEVSFNGDDAGRVYCKICDRYLGAVSSTLKNHLNTQEHRQAYEDSQPNLGGQVPGISSYNPLQPTMHPLSHGQVPTIAYSNFAGLVPGISQPQPGNPNSAIQQANIEDNINKTQQQVYSAMAATNTTELQTMITNNNNNKIAPSAMVRYQPQQRTQQQMVNNCNQTENIDNSNKSNSNNNNSNNGKQSVIYLDYESINTTSETQLATAVTSASTSVSGTSSTMIPSGSESWAVMAAAGQQQQQQQFDSNNNNRNIGNPAYNNNNSNLYKPNNLSRTNYGQIDPNSIQKHQQQQQPHQPSSSFIIPPTQPPSHHHHHTHQPSYFSNSVNGATAANNNNMTVHAYN